MKFVATRQLWPWPDWDVDAGAPDEDSSLNWRQRWLVRCNPPQPTSPALVGRDKLSGSLWGRMKTADGTWLGPATLFAGCFFEGAQLGWHPGSELRTLD